VPGLLIIVLLFGALYFLMIRPQRAKVQAQQRLLNTVEVGDEVLTVGGIYGIVQELEPDEDGGDLVVEIADGIHVRIARKALATIVKPEDDDEEDDEEDAEDVADDGESDDDDDVIDGEAEIVQDAAELSTGGVGEVNGEQVSVNPGAAEGTAPPERS
jgi:preprotein translocase subunit YajC